MKLKRAKISKIVQISFFLMLFVLAGCEKKTKAPVVFDDVLSPVVEANVWFDNPVDGMTIPKELIQVTIHGYVETGLSGFIVQVDDKEPTVIPSTGDQLNLPFQVAHANWTPLTTGWITLKASVKDLNGNPVASTQIQVYVEDVVEPVLVEQPTATPTEVPYSRCDLFDQATTTITLHDIPVLTTDLTAYFTFQMLVPGLEEEIPGDLAVWEYSALLGEFPSNQCTYRGYSQRLYCTFSGFPEWMFGTTQTVQVFVNLCNEPILTFERVSVLKPICEAGMGQDACEWTGGDWECERPGYNCKCVCP